MADEGVTPELARYVVEHYSELMTPAELLADRHLAAAYKATSGRSDAPAQAEARVRAPHGRWVSADPEVLSLAAGGFDALRARVAERILAEHRAEVFLNYCPKCGRLTRTPKAHLRLRCGHDWHDVAAG